MNNIDRENFIFNYLEGNLNTSEHELCEELINTDPAFKEEVEAWKPSFYQKNQPTLAFPIGKSLIPKSTAKYWWITGTIAAITFICFQYHKLNIRTEKLERIADNKTAVLETITDTIYISPKKNSVQVAPRTNNNNLNSSDKCNI